MAEQILLGVIGLSSGFVVAGGVMALAVGLGIFTRYAGITHTAKQIHLYETIVFLGGVGGNLLQIYGIFLPLGSVGLAVLGLGFGIFVGSWILALAEVVNIFPVVSRRVGLTKGIRVVVLAVAAGKVIGSMTHFYMRW